MLIAPLLAAIVFGGSGIIVALLSALLVAILVFVVAYVVITLANHVGFPVPAWVAGALALIVFLLVLLGGL